MAFDKTLIPQDLINSFKRGSAGLYIGAGLSMAVGLPSWDGLLKELIGKVRDLGYTSPSILEQYEELVKDPNKFLILAQELKDKLGGNFNKYISDRFANNVPNPSDSHKKIIKFPYSFIITTNYDTLVENAYAAIHQKQAKVYTFKESGDIANDMWNNRPFILKAHGDANKTQQGIILTEQDYRQIIYQERGYKSVLHNLFGTKTLLFLGSSLSDPELKLLLSYIHSSFHGSGPTHFALIEKEKINSIEAESWLKNYQIQIIPYSGEDSHKELQEFIDFLGDIINTNNN